VVVVVVLSTPEQVEAVLAVCWNHQQPSQRKHTLSPSALAAPAAFLVVVQVLKDQVRLLALQQYLRVAVAAVGRLTGSALTVVRADQVEVAVENKTAAQVLAVQEPLDKEMMVATGR
jgi:hypothetical protein